MRGKRQVLSSAEGGTGGGDKGLMCVYELNLLYSSLIQSLAKAITSVDAGTRPCAGVCLRNPERAFQKRLTIFRFQFARRTQR